MNKHLFTAVLPFCLLAACGGNNKEAESPRQEETSGDKVNQAAQDTKEAAGNAAEEAGDKAQEAGDSAEQAGDKAKNKSHDDD
jgi:outer membrane murein-binding lipoprotein Lpp